MHKYLEENMISYSKYDKTLDQQLYNYRKIPFFLPCDFCCLFIPFVSISFFLFSFLILFSICTVHSAKCLKTRNDNVDNVYNVICSFCHDKLFVVEARIQYNSQMTRSMFYILFTK